MFIHLTVNPGKQALPRFEIGTRDCRDRYIEMLC